MSSYSSRHSPGGPTLRPCWSYRMSRTCRQRAFGHHRVRTCDAPRCDFEKRDDRGAVACLGGQAAGEGRAWSPDSAVRRRRGLAPSAMSIRSGASSKRGERGIDLHQRRFAGHHRRDHAPHEQAPVGRDLVAAAAQIAAAADLDAAVGKADLDRGCAGRRERGKGTAAAIRRRGEAPVMGGELLRDSARCGRRRAAVGARSGRRRRGRRGARGQQQRAADRQHASHAARRGAGRCACEVVVADASHRAGIVGSPARMRAEKSAAPFAACAACVMRERRRSSSNGRSLSTTPAA